MILEVVANVQETPLKLEVIEFIEGTGRYEDGYFCKGGYFVTIKGIVEHLEEDGTWSEWGLCPKLKNEWDLIQAATT